MCVGVGGWMGGIIIKLGIFQSSKHIRSLIIVHKSNSTSTMRPPICIACNCKELNRTTELDETKKPYPDASNMTVIVLFERSNCK
jgi:hypothetical protein